MPAREPFGGDVSKTLFFQYLAKMSSLLPVVPGGHAVPEGMRKNDKMVEKALLQHVLSYENVFSRKFGRPDFDTEADLMHTEAWRSRHFCSFWPVRTPGAPSPAFFCPFFAPDRHFAAFVSLCVVPAVPDSVRARQSLPEPGAERVRPDPEKSPSWQPGACPQGAGRALSVRLRRKGA